MSNSDREARQRRPTVDLVIPVLNEAHVLERSVNTVRAFLEGRDTYRWRLVIVENGSTDGTAEVARRLAASGDDVAFLEVDRVGRGGALRRAWTESEADVVCYTDVDLSTDLEALPPLVAAIVNDGYDLAVGSRLLRGSRTVRSLHRELISRGYNLFLKLMLGVSFSDAQCGFKAVRREVVDEIVPRVRHQSWFFDTELLVLAERAGYSIKEIPVTWVEDVDSRVRIISTAWEDIRGVVRIRFDLWRRRPDSSDRRAGRGRRRAGAGTPR